MSVKLSEVPGKYFDEVIKEMLEWRSKEGVLEALRDDITIKQAFPWQVSKRGHRFWEQVNNGEDPEDSKENSMLEVLTEEAERRGFAIGVMTRYGIIEDKHDNELQSNGDFFYRNIKVYKDGEWIKAGEQPSGQGNDEAAIHALLLALASAIGDRSSSPFSNPGLN
jgi:hypothetical protein